ncbi:uncharacterized protein PFL1_03778 [Pseudozyma flocculosa PF-1]|uniref:Uncharacterized protein n=1 Tax=Pseudozyma flocculosa PF-1 TaxID=1277687 RepID=A0A061H8X7_9BASI|nr:uncharacterized protein PFL1_03778 [Pseudozyma flocculosa PF-1]EPQ28475.1 hypothetical protein PFL1_03778 [Pseudozyma flocculosa PF-1]
MRRRGRDEHEGRDYRQKKGNEVIQHDSADDEWQDTDGDDDEDLFEDSFDFLGHSGAESESDDDDGDGNDNMLDSRSGDGGQKAAGASRPTRYVELPALLTILVAYWSQVWMAFWRSKSAPIPVPRPTTPPPPPSRQRHAYP